MVVVVAVVAVFGGVDVVVVVIVAACPHTSSWVRTCCKDVLRDAGCAQQMLLLVALRTYQSTRYEYHTKTVWFRVTFVEAANKFRVVLEAAAVVSISTDNTTINATSILPSTRIIRRTSYCHR